jgi:biopolymer transport protein TolR
MMMNEGNKKKFMSDINVTPFVDVMLVLLIIFMVTAPMMIEGVAVNLPETKAKSIKTTEDPLILTVTKDGGIFLERTEIKPEDLENKLKSIMKYRQDNEILLKGDREVQYGFVVQVMASIKRAGVDKLGMVTEPAD